MYYLPQNASLIQSNPAILDETDVPAPVTSVEPVAIKAALDEQTVVNRTTTKTSTGYDFIDNSLDRLGLSSGRGFWGAVILILVTFIYFSAQWRGVGRKLENAQNRLDEVSALVAKMAETQAVLTENLSKQSALFENLLGQKKNGRVAIDGKLIELSNEMNIDPIKLSELTAGIDSVSLKLDSVHRDLEILMKAKVGK